MKPKLSPEQQDKALLLIIRFNRAAASCARMIGNDDSSIIYAYETGILSGIVEVLKAGVDDGKLRVESCLRLMEAVLDAQEDCIRCAQQESERIRRQ